MIKKMLSRIASFKSDFSIKTVVALINEFRDNSDVFINNTEKELRGPGITIQANEYHFGKRKYYRRHRVESVWIQGGVQETPEKKNVC